jgi:hypothetical protein
MKWHDYLLLGLLGLTVLLGVAAFQPVPGYMDADYYYAGGLQLAAGKGFTEPYLWNYLDDPSGLPHPSNAYWMPLASLLAALGAGLFGPGSWSAGRVGFIAVGASLPPLTAALAWSFSSRRDLAWLSGLLAVFSGFYLPFLASSDTFGLYMLFGGLFFLSMQRPTRLAGLGLGFLAGLMHLSRADGLLWLVLAFLAVTVFSTEVPGRKQIAWIRLLLVLAGYLLVIGPWFARNLSVFGALLAPGGTRLLWLTSYDQLFSYPAAQLSFTHWWQSGLASILKARAWALGLNLASFFSVEMEVFLLPLVLVGTWHLRRDRRLLLALLAWFLTLAAMTFAFPFAGARGGFFHSGAALQTVWWVLAPLGLERSIEWAAGRRGWQMGEARLVFRGALVFLAVLFSTAVLGLRVFGWWGSPVWGQDSTVYAEVGQYLDSQGVPPGATVVVSNPPGFYLATGHPAIAVPYGDADTLVTLARDFRAGCIVLEKGSLPAGLQALYDHPQSESRLKYLGQVEEARVFVVGP